MSVGVFISGRLKSERLPNKLILPIGDSCLWEMACQKMDVISKQYPCYALAEEGVLSDIARKYSNIETIIRDQNTAEVDSPLSYIFKELSKVDVDYLMFLNPCQSFISVETILASLKEFENSGNSYATSVMSLRNWLFDSVGASLSPIDYRVLSTKEIEPLFQAAHCFHIFDKKQFFEDGLMLKEGHGLIEIPEPEIIDVDTKEDYEYVRWKHEVCI